MGVTTCSGGKRRCHPSLLRGADPHGGEYLGTAAFPHQIDHFHGLPKVLDRVPGYVANDRSLPARPDDTAPFVQTIVCQSYQRLPGQMAHGLLRIGPADHHETKVGIAKDVPDEPFRAQVFCLQGADDGDPRIPFGGDLLRQFAVGQGAHRHRSPIPQHLVTSR